LDPEEWQTEFPTVKGKNLEGNQVNIPADLHGRMNVMIVAFQQWHQAHVDTWVEFLSELKERYTGFDFYELPTLGSEYRLARFIIDGGMRAGIPSKATRVHTVTLYLDKRAFKKSLDIPDERSIRLYAIDREGHIYWRAIGPFDRVSSEELGELVESSMPE
jgi:hypothetical protein